jgi:hypothetical protein
MNRRTLLRRTAGMTALVVAGGIGARGGIARAVFTADGLADLGLPEVTIRVDDEGFTVPAVTAAGRVLMTVANAGAKDLHFFAARVPDEISDEQLAAELTAEREPAWFDITTLPMLGNPDWPAPGGQAQGVVDLTPGRWLLVDPLEGREVALWSVAEGESVAAPPEPPADVELGMAEMSFAGLDGAVPAGPRVWKITNQGAMEHEVALLPVPADSTEEGLIRTLSEMLEGKGDPAAFAPVGGQGIASKGVTAWHRFDLDPGSYAAVCMSPMPGEDFTPHAMLGMVKVFAVR